MPTRASSSGCSSCWSSSVVYVLYPRPCLTSGSSSSSRFSGRRRPGRARWRWRSRSGIGGEIINCDSTAVYRGFDIGTDKVRAGRAARHSASPDRHRRSDRRVHGRAVRARCRRGRFATFRRAAGCRFVVGGTGLLLPCADARAVSGARAATARCASVSSRSPADAARRFCIACCSASIRRRRARIQPRDLKRMVRALEVFFLTGRPLTPHFAETASPIAGHDGRADRAAAAGGRRRRRA